jgi:tripartite-type tricarboxylate transporter receptor subunit TctC
VVTVGSAPEELANKVKSEIAKMSKVIKDAGIKTE